MQLTRQLAKATIIGGMGTLVWLFFHFTGIGFATAEGLLAFYSGVLSMAIIE